MFELNKIYNEKCSKTLRRMYDENYKFDLILTSPPYNTGRPSNSERSRNHHEGRYDVHIDAMTSEQYVKAITKLFNMFDKTLCVHKFYLCTQRKGRLCMTRSWEAEQPLWLVKKWGLTL